MMFEAVVIDREYFDLGAIAEAMVYFGRVELIVDRGRFEALVESMTPEQLIRALEGGYLHLRFFDSFPASPNLIGPDGRPAIYLEIISMAGRGGAVIWETPREVMWQSYLRRFGVTKANRAILDRISKYTTFEGANIDNTKKTLDELYESPIIPDLATKYFQEFYKEANLLDLKFSREVVMNPGRSVSEVVAIVPETNFQFDVPGAGSRPNLTNFAMELLSMNSIVTSSAAANTDLWLKGTTSALLGNKIAALERLRTENSRQIGDFESVILDKLSFRNLINQRAISFKQIIDLIEDNESRRMKIWLRDQKPGHHIVTEYHKAILSKEPKLTPIQNAVKIVAWEGISSTIVNIITGGVSVVAQPIVSSMANIALSQTESAGVKFIAGKFAKWTPRAWVDRVVQSQYSRQ